MNWRGRYGATAIPLSMAFVMIVTALLVATSGGLYARMRENLRLRNELTAIRQALAEQAILHPLYVELMQKQPTQTWAELTKTSRNPLAREAIVGIPDRFAKAATACGLTLGSVSPRISKNGNDKRLLLVDVQATGPFLRLREFLIAMMVWPSFVRVEQIEVKEYETQQEIRLQASLELD